MPPIPPHHCIECPTKHAHIDHQPTKGRSATKLRGKPVSYQLLNHRLSKNDILQYIEQKTAHVMRKRSTLAPKEDLIVQRLQSGAQGIFELVNTALHHVEMHISSPNVLDEYLDDLPTTMENVYEKIFKRIRPTSKVAMTRFQTALQILAVSATPVTAIDLQIALRVSQLMKDSSKDAALRDLCTTHWSRRQRQDAKRDILQMLDCLVAVDESGFVTLVHPSLRHSLLSDRDFTGEEQSSRYTPGRAWYQFSETQAHLLVADVCIATCGHTTLAQANIFAVKPPLLTYSWNYWAYHLRASGFNLSNSTPRTTRTRNGLDNMLRQVHQHSLSFLSALGVFVTSPLEPVAGSYSILEYRQSLQRAQHSTASAITALCKSREAFPIAAKLHQERERIPENLNDIPADSKYQSVVKWGRSTASSLRKWLARDQTRVTRVKADALMDTTPLPNLYGSFAFPEPIHSVLDSARALRRVALTFAVNPIHAALMRKAGLTGFSPIHMLVYVAQLFEEAASFPYWKHLLEVLDPADAFICDTSDPQAGPAKFVLRLVDWQRPNKHLSAELGESGSDWSVRFLATQGLSHRLRELSEVTAHRWIAARFGLDIFYADPGSEDGWLQRHVANPISNMHIREKLYMLDVHDKRPWPVFLDPTKTLDLKAPTVLRDAPVKEVLTALPSMLMFIYAKYVAILLELFTEIPRAGVVAHFIQLSTSRTELYAFANYIKSLPTKAPRRLWHVPLALILYYLRVRFFPNVGAHAMNHSVRDMLLSYRHPAAYLNLQSFHDAWFWFKYALEIRLWNAVGRTFVAFSQVEGLRCLPEVQLVSDTLAGLYYIVTLERNVFGLGFSLAILTASAKVIMYDRENLSAVGYLTFWYLVMNGFSVFNIVVGAMLQQNQASFLQGLAVVVPEFLILIVAIIYHEHTIWIAGVILGWLVWPVTGPAMLAWRLGLYLYAPLLKLAGVVVFLLLVLLAAIWMEKAVWDPHDLEGSRNEVTAALTKIRKLRDTVERLEVGDLKAKLGRLEETQPPVDPNIAGRNQQPDDDWGAWDAWDVDGGEAENSEEKKAFTTQDETPIARHPPSQDLVGDITKEEALEIFGKTVLKELEQGFIHVLQSLRHLRFDSTGGWGSAPTVKSRTHGFRDTSSFLPPSTDKNNDAYLQQRGNGWSFGGLTPGAPFGQISYYYKRTTVSHDGKIERSWFWDDMFFYLIFGFVVACWVVAFGWVLWPWWSGSDEAIGEGVGRTKAPKQCWEIGPVPILLIYFGYSSCDGWSWGFDLGLLFA